MGRGAAGRGGGAGVSGGLSGPGGGAGGGARGGAGPPPRPVTLLASGAAAALVLLPQIAISTHSPFPVLDHAWVTGWSPANVLSSRFDNIDGHFDYAQVNAAFYARPLYDAYFMAPIFTPFALIGAWALRRRRAQALLLVLWALLPYLFLAGIPYQNIRFPLIVFPATAVLAGYGLATVLRARTLLAVVLGAGLVWSISASQPVIADFVAHQQRDQRAVWWAVKRVPPAARLYTFELTEPLAAYAPFAVRELYDETPESIDAQLADGTASYLFANVWVIEHQWQGHTLDETYRWLRDRIGLEYLDRIGNYWLFRIRHENRNAAARLQRTRG